jgi:FtsZ-binding cell division protein ZapB
MPPKPTREALILENSELKDALAVANETVVEQINLKENNNDLQLKLDNVLSKLDQILDENAHLREQNLNFADRIRVLEELLKSNDNSRESCAVLSAQPAFEAPQKERYDALVLSDSLLRHVGIECPKVRDPKDSRVKPAIIRDIPVRFTSNLHLKVKKLVVPGACCDRIFSEAVILSQAYEFEEVIVHIGTNHLNRYSPDETAIDIENLLRALKELFRCNVTFSPILPRVSHQEQDPENRYEPLLETTFETINMLRYINDKLADYCYTHGFGRMVCPEFAMDDCDPYPDKSLLCKDGIHLSRKGINKMDHALFDHLSMKFWIY